MNSLNIAVICYPQMLFSSVALPIEMLAAGHQIFKSRRRDDRRLIITYYSTDPIISDNGLSIACQPLPETWQADLIVLPAIWRNPSPVLAQQTDTITALKKAHKQGITIASVGSSAFMLAESGFLDGYPATTHWAYANVMQTRYPKILLTKKHFITHANGIYCCASINALADLTVHLIGKFMNEDSARLVERNFSHEIRRAYDQQTLIEGQDSPVSDEMVATMIEIAKDSPRDAWSLEETAKRFDLSTRTVQRRFKQAMNQTYSSWLEKTRLEEANSLLKSSNLLINEVAEYTGFNSESYFIARYKQHYGLTPNAYRETTRGKQFG